MMCEHQIGFSVGKGPQNEWAEASKTYLIFDLSFQKFEPKPKVNSNKIVSMLV